MDSHSGTLNAYYGDEQAFLQLMELHQRKLYGIAYSYLHHEADALDMVQQTVYKAWLKRGRLKDPKLFTPWLYRILINCCIDEQRRRKKRGPVSKDSSLSLSDATEMVYIYRMDLNHAMQHMKPKYRHVLTLRYFQDMTVPEIARVLQTSEGTIKTWIHQGLKKLKVHMNQGGEGYRETF